MGPALGTNRAILNDTSDSIYLSINIILSHDLFTRLIIFLWCLEQFSCCWELSRFFSKSLFMFPDTFFYRIKDNSRKGKGPLSAFLVVEYLDATSQSSTVRKERSLLQHS